MKTVTAADANRYFSRILREVQAGESVLVTSRGKPVATIAPAAQLSPDRMAAWVKLKAHLDAQPALNLGRISRDGLYDD